MQASLVEARVSKECKAGPAKNKPDLVDSLLARDSGPAPSSPLPDIGLGASGHDTRNLQNTDDVGTWV